MAALAAGVREERSLHVWRLVGGIEPGRVVIPAAVRARTGLRPGTSLDVLVDDLSVRLVRRVPARRRLARPPIGRGPGWSFAGKSGYKLTART